MDPGKISMERRLIHIENERLLIRSLEQQDLQAIRAMAIPRRSTKCSCLMSPGDMKGIAAKPGMPSETAFARPFRACHYEGPDLDDRMTLTCCSRGTRPVIFRIERIDIPETSEEKEWLSRADVQKYGRRC